MNQSYLTRKDLDVGAGSFDSIAWAFESHVKQRDTMIYNFALLHGNEDCPEKIEFWSNEPDFDTPADYVYVRTD